MKVAQWIHWDIYAENDYIEAVRGTKKDLGSCTFKILSSINSMVIYKAYIVSKKDSLGKSKRNVQTPIAALFLKCTHWYTQLRLVWNAMSALCYDVSINNSSIQETTWSICKLYACVYLRGSVLSFLLDLGAWWCHPLKYSCSLHSCTPASYWTSINADSGLWIFFLWNEMWKNNVNNNYYIMEKNKKKKKNILFNDVKSGFKI